MSGHKVWFFPDGDLPPRGNSEPHGHESLILLNAGDAEASVTLTVYFPDSDPVTLDAGTVGAQRVRCIRTDEPIAGYSIPFGQYALRVESTEPLICQIGRMDVRQPNLAYYTVMGFPG